MPSKAKAQMTNGQGNHWIIESPTYVSVLFLNIFTLLAVEQSVDNLFHSLIVLCENEYFLIPILIACIQYAK